MPRAVPTLWLCGPPGVGKTAVGTEIYAALAAEVPAGYVDIDQLGICYPESSSDPDRHRLKARNLDAVVAAFGALGARCVVVSGVVEETRGPAVAEIPSAEIMLCRLVSESSELARRLVDRGSPPGDVERILREAQLLEESGVGHERVDTTGMTPADVAAEVLGRIGWLPRGRGVAGAGDAELPSPSAELRSALPRKLVWLSGVTGAGKSTVGFAVFRRLLGAGLGAAYVDVGQLGFCRPAPSDGAGVALLARIAANFAGAGAAVLVAVGAVGQRRAAGPYVSAFAGAEQYWFQLTASPEELTRRILDRGRGGSWREPGDPLVGQPPDELGRVATRALEEQAEQEHAVGEPPGPPLPTDGRTADEVAAEIVEQVLGE